MLKNNQYDFLSGIRTVYQNRYCDTSDYGSKHVTKSLKECADKCVRSYRQFIYGRGKECYCYMSLQKNLKKCTQWKEDNNYIQYAFNEPGWFELFLTGDS